MTLSDFPNEMPVLNLDFLNSKQLDPRISFARASSGTTVIGQGYGDVNGDNYLFQENVPRLTDKGLLIEQATTQYAKSNINGSDFGWGTGSESTEVAPPFGDPTASVRRTDGRAQCITKGNPPDGTTEAFFSMYVKPGNWRRFAFRIVVGGYAYRWFDLSGTTPLVFIDNDRTPAEPGTFICEQYPNDWWRIGVKATGWGYKTVYMFDYDEDGNPIRNSANPGGQPSGSYFYAWGSQAETNGFCTSFIPNPNTNNTLITRAADVCSITGDNFSSWYNQPIGTVCYSFNSPLEDESGYYAMLITADTSSIVDGYRFDLTRIYPAKSDGGNGWSLVTDWLETDYIQNAENNLAFTYDRVGNYNAVANNGTLAESNTSATDTTISPAALTIGGSDVGNGFSGYFSRISYYPTRVSNDTLEALST